MKKLLARLRQVEHGVWAYYLVFLLSLAAEGTFAKLLEHYGGFILVFLVFSLVGLLLGFWELRTIDADKPLHDPLLRLAVRITRRYFLVGYLANAVVFGGAPGVAIVAVKLHHARAAALTVLASALFAAFWSVFWCLV